MEIPILSSYSSTTGSDGVASFTLSDGSPDNVKVMDDRTGDPISGMSVILVTDGTDSAYFLIDPNKEYAPAILNVSNLSVTTSSSANDIRPQVIGLIREAYLTFVSRVVERDKATPLTADRIPLGLSQYIIENFFQYQRTTTVSELYDKLWDVGVPTGEFIFTLLMDWNPLGWVNHVIMGIETVTSLQYYAWEKHYRCRGYLGSEEVDIYQNRLNQLIKIVIPTESAPNTVSPTTSISGKVVNSRTGSDLADVNLYLFPLGDRKSTDSNGNYTFTFDSVSSSCNSYSIQAFKLGYDPNKLTGILVTLGADNPDNNISLNPIVSATEEYRIVLEWGENPDDLDSHLWTPSIDGTSYHIYYVTEDDHDDLSSPPYADLDLDDVTSYGPETITIASLQPGTYTYAVYHYAGSGTITTSGATVKVYDSIGLLQSFAVPTTTSGSNYWWTVFTIDGATGQITPVDSIDSNSPQAFSVSASGVK